VVNFNLLLDLWPIILFLFGLSFAAGGAIVRIIKLEKWRVEQEELNKKQSKAIKDVEDGFIQDLKDRLYDRNHEPLFVPSARCEKTHKDQNDILKEVRDGIKSMSELIHRHLGEHNNTHHHYNKQKGE
jgi:hypothetical protein